MAAMTAAPVMSGSMFTSHVLFAQGWMGETEASAEVIRAIGLFLVGWAAPFALAAAVIYVLFSLPLRRRERARFFLDLIETGLAQGWSPEQTLVGAAQCRDSSPGVRFHLLAAQVESGCRLSQALDRVPRLLPPQITAMLQVGENLGNLGRVLPACRAVLDQGLAGAAGALHSMPLLFYLMLPAPFLILWFLPVMVLPRYEQIMSDFGVSLPPVYTLIFNQTWVITLLSSVLFLLLAAYFLAYWGGPRLQAWSRSVLGSAIDKIGHRIPWRRHRLQRDFVRMLALLLDAGVPEARAVMLAAEATANGVVLKQAARAADDLGQGKPLPEAMRRMDRRGEFQWRLANAVHGPGHFTQALAGWGEALDAQAFQQEQVGMQLFTTGFVLANGFLVGLIFVGVFSVLVQLVEEAVLW